MAIVWKFAPQTHLNFMDTMATIFHGVNMQFAKEIVLPLSIAFLLSSVAYLIIVVANDSKTYSPVYYLHTGDPAACDNE